MPIGWAHRWVTDGSLFKPRWNHGWLNTQLSTLDDRLTRRRGTSQPLQVASNVWNSV